MALRWTEEELQAFRARSSLRWPPAAAGRDAAAAQPEKKARRRTQHKAAAGPADPVTPVTPLTSSALLGEVLMRTLYIVMTSGRAGAYLARHPDWRASEHTHQVLFFMTLDAWAGQDPRRQALRDDIVGTTNGGFLRPGQGGRLRHAGARRGVPDIEAWIPSRDEDGTILHGLAIEMKRPCIRGPNGKQIKAPGRLSDEQSRRLERLKSRGYRAEVAYGVEDALMILGEHLENARTVERVRI